MGAGPAGLERPRGGLHAQAALRRTGAAWALFARASCNLTEAFIGRRAVSRGMAGRGGEAEELGVGLGASVWGRDASCALGADAPEVYPPQSISNGQKRTSVCGLALELA